MLQIYWAHDHYFKKNMFYHNKFRLLFGTAKYMLVPYGM